MFEGDILLVGENCLNKSEDSFIFYVRILIAH